MAILSDNRITRNTELQCRICGKAGGIPMFSRRINNPQHLFTVCPADAKLLHANGIASFYNIPFDLAMYGSGKEAEEAKRISQINLYEDE